MQARSDVSAHLYADSVACCEWLRAQGLQVALLTNGNAVLSLCSNPLAPLLSLTLGAGDVGANKPSPVRVLYNNTMSFIIIYNASCLLLFLLL